MKRRGQYIYMRTHMYKEERPGGNNFFRPHGVGDMGRGQGNGETKERANGKTVLNESRVPRNVPTTSAYIHTPPPFLPSSFIYYPPCWPRHGMRGNARCKNNTKHLQLCVHACVSGKRRFPEEKSVSEGEDERTRGKVGGRNVHLRTTR